MPNNAIALEAASLLTAIGRALFEAEFAQTKLGVTSINIIANVSIDAAMRLSLLNFTNSPERTALGSLGPVMLVDVILKDGERKEAQGDRVLQQISEQQRRK